jgi:hypothetical protein
MKRFTVLVAVAVMLAGCAGEVEHKDHLPPGYTMLHNANGLHVWESATHTKAQGVSKQEAIDAAWSDYNQAVYVECDE